MAATTCRHSAEAGSCSRQNEVGPWLHRSTSVVAMQ